MGVYINPPSETKEAFLTREGLPITTSAVRQWDFSKRDCLPVALVNNGPFTAAGVAYDHREAEEFTRPSDPRPRAYFAVPIEVLLDPDKSGIHPVDHDRLRRGV